MTSDKACLKPWGAQSSGPILKGNLGACYSSVLLLSLLSLTVLSSCGKNDTQTNTVLESILPNGRTLAAITGPNVMEVTVNGSLCSNTYLNKPCVSVKVCAPGDSSNCQTINDILLDTGSYGLRVFKSTLPEALNSALTQVTTGGGQPILECAQFGDGSADWGPVKIASLTLGGEPAVELPIQVIDSTAATIPNSCGGGDADTGPSDAGFNGILGVGLFSEDCGVGCTTHSNNGSYFSCTSLNSGATCSGTTVPLSKQVQNPVPLFPEDNNGLILSFPSIPFGGVTSVNGYLIFGVGTQANNIPLGVTKYAADPNYGEFTVSFDGKSIPSFLDSGSNGYFFPGPSSNVLTDCGLTRTSASGWFCPSSTQSLSAITFGDGGLSSASVAFQIGNFLNLVTKSRNNVFVEIGADVTLGGAEVFDWGLPFYLGRNVYLGVENSTSTLGTGPYWAY